MGLREVCGEVVRLERTEKAFLVYVDVSEPMRVDCADITEVSTSKYSTKFPEGVDGSEAYGILRKLALGLPMAYVRTVKKGSLADVQREYVTEVLKQSKTKEEAIKILGISRATLWRMIHDYGIKDEIKD